MKTQELKEKLHKYIETAEDKKLKAIYTMVEEEIEETDNCWEDEVFIGELERREKEYLNGRAKTYSLEETLAGVNEVIKKVKAKK